MKAISKKLLSMLVVMAMVLSMVPFGGLSIFAVETKAAETDTQSTETTNPGADEIQRGKDVQTAANAMTFPAEGGDYEAYCPACEETVTWHSKKINTHVNLFSDQVTDDTFEANNHVYLIAPANDHTGGINFVTTNGLGTTSADTHSICVHLNGQDIRYAGRFFINKSITLNIMGEGSLTSTAARRTSTYGAFQVSANDAEINLYGGTFGMLLPEEVTLTAPTGTTSYYANVGLNGSGISLNIYEDAVLKSETTNIATARKNTINLYGGTIQDGQGYQYHSKDTPTSSTTDWALAGGNVYLRGSGATFNMYAGTISGGTATMGGNVSVYQGGVFNQYDGEISGGIATGNYGGNIALGVEPAAAYVADSYGGTFNQYGGTVSGGEASNCGGNIGMRAGTANISGTVSGGKVDTTTVKGSGGNVYIMNGKLNLDGATITQDGTTATAVYGGNITIGNKLDVTMQNSTISGGVAALGGNIYCANGQNIDITNCTITGGTTAATTAQTQSNGGNIYLQQSHTVVTITDSQISGGTADGKYGGNIYCTKGAVNIAGSTTVTGGTANQGGNLWLGGASDDPGEIVISGGTVSGGNATYGDDLRIASYGQVTMTGGEIAGEVWAQDAVGNNAPDYGTLTVSGAAKIGYVRSDGSGIILIDGGLTEGASIGYYNVNKNFVQYADQTAAEAAKGYYHASQSGYGVVVNSDGTLMLGEVEAEYDQDVFQPWEFDDAKAYCPVCDADITGWQALTSSGANLVAEGGAHWYLADSMTLEGTQKVYAYNADASVEKSGCFNLNGKTLSLTGRIGLTGTSTLNILDTSADHSGVVTTDCSSNDTANNYIYTVRVQVAGTVNLYGGTFRNTYSAGVVVNTAGSADAAVIIHEGAVIDGGNTAVGVKVANGSVTLNGGEIKNGYTTSSGGNVQVDKGTFTMNSGKIYGGSADTHGGNISGTTNGTVKILGGEVYGGVAKMQAGNIRIWGGDLTVGGNAYIYDGDAQGTNTVNNNIWVQGTDDTTGQSLTIEGTPVITGDVFVGNGTVTMSGAPTISMGDNIGFRFSGGTAATAWATANTQVDVSGLTEGASIVVTAADGAVLSKACASAEDAARIAGYFSCSDSSLTVAAATDNTLVVKASVVEEPPMDVFAPWNYEGRAYCEACEAYADWIPMADDVAVDLSQKISGTEAASVNRPGTVSDGGHHHAYLAESYTFAGNWGAVTAGSLCLHTNGNTVTYKGRLFVSGAEFNVLGNGKITSDCSNVYGDGVLVAANSATVTLYGGTLETTAENGGPALILRAGADVTMKDGAVIDGTGVARCVKFEAGATNPVSFTMEGGIIRNGFFSSDATGRKTAGQDDSWGISNGYNGGGNVWVQYGTFTMNGGVIQDGIAGAGLKDDGATYNQSYGGNVYIASGGTMEMNNQAVVSGGKAASSWIGGNIYMTTNTAALTMNGSSQILNGSRIATDNAAKVNTGSGANIFCNGGTITMNGSSQITNIAENKTDTAGNVRLNGETNNAKLVMNGEALISGGSANGNGGSVELRQTNGTATLEMNGGTITGGNANAGGNIYNNGGTLDLNAGTVTLGAANSSGGNIYHAAGTLEQAADHEVTGGTAAADEVNGKGGNLFLGASADMNGTVSGGNTNYSGGNAHLSGSTTVLTIGTTGQFLGLEEGSTVKYGGNIATEGSSTVTVYGTVADGHAVTRGGNFDIMGAGILNIENGAQVKDGVGVNAGNIFAQNASAKININGGAITGGQGTSAGNLYIMKATVTMTGGSISGGSNTGTAAAHNVFLTTDSTMNMSGGTVYGTDGAEKAGTGIRINSAVLNLSGDASVIRADGIHQFVIQCQTTGLIQIDNSWEGTAAVSFNNTYDYGEVIDPHANDTDATRDYYVVCGTLGSDGSFTRGGSYANGHLIYAQPARGCPEIVGVDGLCYVAGYAVVDTESNTTTWSTTADLAAVNGSETKYLLAGAAVALNGETVYIDALAGINVTGSGTVYGIDPANADFTTASTGSITAGEDVTLASDVTFGGVRYIKLADGSVHAIKMGISGVSLRPTAVGLYYKATYKCDAKLAAAIDAYGVVLSVYDMPGADFADVATDQFTVREDFASLYADNTVTANSGSVFGIMKDGRENNQERGEMKIYANAYILVEGAAIYVGDNDNAGKSTEDEGFDGVALSLYDVLKKIDDKVTDGSLTLTPTNIEQITELYGKIKAWGVNWTFTNIQ